MLYSINDPQQIEQHYSGVLSLIVRHNALRKAYVMDVVWSASVGLKSMATVKCDKLRHAMSELAALRHGQ